MHDMYGLPKGTLSNPVLLDIRHCTELGPTKQSQNGYFIWFACVDCGKTSWTPLRKIKHHKVIRCCSCTRRLIVSNPEHRAGMRVRGRLLWDNPEFRAKQAAINADPNRVELRRKNTTRMWSNPDYREKQRLAFTPEDRIKQGEATSRGQTPEIRKRMSQTHKAMWEDPDYKTKTLIKLHLANQTKPTQPEITIMSILNDLYPGKWEYVGSGKKIVGCKNPDFWNGDHKIIEHFGDYWHNPVKFPNRMTDAVLVQYYAQLGYKCLIIWEHDIKKHIELVRSRIKEFADE